MIKILTLILGLLIFSGCTASKQDKLIKVSKQNKKNLEKVDSLFEIKRKEVLTDIINQPKIPVKTPDKILRILILPYVDKNNNLQTQNYHFIKVDDGRWIIGEYLYGEGNNAKSQLLTPLEN